MQLAIAATAHVIMKVSHHFTVPSNFHLFIHTKKCLSGQTSVVKTECPEMVPVTGGMI